MTTKSTNPVRIVVTVFLGMQVRGIFIDRDATAFDSRFCCGPTTNATPVTTLYAVLSGRMSTRLHESDGPALWLMNEPEFERRRSDAMSFRIEGPRAVTLYLCAPSQFVLAPQGLSHGPMPLPLAARRAIESMTSYTMAADLDTLMERFAAFWSALVGEGIVRDLDERWTAEEEPPALRRLWAGVGALFGSQDLTGQAEQAAELAQISIRQLRRDAAEISTRNGLGGFRRATRVFRVRRAVLLLSVPALSVEAVARLSGYSGATAMARAFRDEGLPSPTEVRVELARSVHEIDR